MLGLSLLSMIVGVGAMLCFALALLSLWRGWQWLRTGNRFNDEDRCPGCQYLLTGLRDERCPECGARATAEDRAHWKQAETITTQRAALSLLGGLMLIAGGTVMLAIVSIIMD
jgi:hypothetical protein